MGTALTGRSNERPRVLLVEDETLVAMELEDRLTRLGIEVTGVVNTARRAIEEVDRQPPDLVLIDVRLKGPEDGIWAASEIRKHHNLPIVYLTAHADDETLARAQATAPHGYLLKPFEERALFATVTMALIRHRVETMTLLRAEGDKRHRAVLDHMPDGVVVVDATSRIVDANRAAERTFGFPAGGLVGAELDEILPPEVFGSHREWIADLATSAAVARRMAPQRNVRGRRKDDTEFPAEVSIFSFEQNRTPLFGAIVRDIGEQQRLENESAQAHRLEAVGLLSSAIAHDFNNILAAMRMEVAVLRLADPDDVRLGLEALVMLVERGAALTRQLLSFSTQSLEETEEIDVSSALASSQQFCSRLLGRDISCEVQVPADLGRVRLPPGQLSQILMNLILNARDAMPSGGVLRLRAVVECLRDVDAASLEVGEGDFVRIEISDTGTGMTEDVRKHVFDPFFTTKAPGAGTGLGLTSVHRFVRRANGAVTVNSSLGEGTTIAVLLPQAAPAASHADARDDANHVAVEERETRPKSVLVVDDNRELLATIESLLTEHGYQIIAVSGPGAALAELERRTPVDVLLTDIAMPIMSGVELAERVRRYRPGIGVVLMTGFNHGQVTPEHAIEGVARLQKPFSPVELRRALAQATRRSS